MEKIKDLPVRKMREYKCTNCGAPMSRFFGNHVYCDYCGAVYADEEILRVVHIPQKMEIIGAGIRVNEKEFERCGAMAHDIVREELGRKLVGAIAPKLVYRWDRNFDGTVDIKAQIGVCFLE